MKEIYVSVREKEILKLLFERRKLAFEQFIPPLKYIKALKNLFDKIESPKNLYTKWERLTCISVINEYYGKCDCNYNDDEEKDLIKLLIKKCSV
jgi:hypothetical protein